MRLLIWLYLLVPIVCFSAEKKDEIFLKVCVKGEVIEYRISDFPVNENDIRPDVLILNFTKMIAKKYDLPNRRIFIPGSFREIEHDDWTVKMLYEYVKKELVLYCMMY